MGDNFQQVIQLAFEVLDADAAQRVADVLEGVGDAGGKANAQLGPLVDEFQQLAEKSELVSKAIDLKAQAEANAAAFERAKTSLAALNAEFDKSDKSNETINQAFRQAQQEVNRLSKEQLGLQQQLSSTNDELKQSGVDVEHLGTAQDDLKVKTQDAARKLTDAANAAKESGSAFDSVREFAKNAGDKLKEGADHALEFGKKLLEITGIAGVVTSALATISGFRFFEKGVEEAKSGEIALAGLKAAVGGNAEAFEHLKEAAEKAAETVKTTSNDAVNTTSELVRQLGNYDAAAKALPGTLTLAKAAQIGFNESADLVAQTLKAFGLNAEYAGQVADKLAAIAAQTGANLAELARGAAQLAPIAKEAGVGFDGIASALAELASKGFDAQKATAGLREFFTALAAPTSKLRQDLVGLGVDTSSFGSILDGLRIAGDRGVEALQDLSVKGRAAVLGLVRDGSAGLQQFQQILDDSAGAASRTAKLLGDTLDGALKGFGRTVDSLAEDAVKGALPAVETELRKLKSELDEVGKSDAFAKVKDGIKEFVATAVASFDEFVHKVDWANLGKTIADFATSAKASLVGLADAARIVSGVFGGIADAVSFSWNVIKVWFDSVAAAVSLAASHVVTSLADALEAIAPFDASMQVLVANWRALAKQYADNASQFWAAGDAAAEKAGAALTDLGRRIVSAGENAKDAAPKHAQHAAALDSSAKSAEQARAVFDALPLALQAQVRPFLDAALAAGQHGDALTKSADEAAKAGSSQDALKGQLAASKSELLGSLDAYDKLRGTLGATDEQLAAARQRTLDAANAYSELQRQAGASAISLGHSSDALHGLRNSTGQLLPDIDSLIQRFHGSDQSIKDLRSAAVNLQFTLQTDLAQAADRSAESFARIAAASTGSAADLADVRNAFLDYAKKQLEAIKNLDEGQRSQALAMLASRAAGLDLTNVYSGLADAILSTSVKAREAAGNYLLGVEQAKAGAQLQQEQMVEGARRAEEYRAAMARLSDATLSLEDHEKALAASMDSATSATERQAAAAEGAEIKMRSEMGAAQSLGQIMANTGAQFSSVSEAAGREFTQALDHALTSIGLVKEGTTDLTKSMGDLRNAADTGSGVVSFFKALEAVQTRTQQKIDDQRQSLAEQISLLDQLGTAGQKNFGLMGNSASSVLDNLERMKDNIAAGNSGFNLLGDQELGPLQQALDSAIQRTQQLSDAARAAEQQYESLAQSIHDSLLQEQGNQSAIEDERHKKQLADLKAAAEAANTFNSQSYQQAVQEENELHALKMNNIAAQDAATKKSSSSSSASSSASTPAPAPSAPGPNSAAAPAGPTYHNEFNMQFYGFGAGNTQDFVRQVKIELDKIAARSK